MIEINGMAHVILTVSRFEVARAFYRELLPRSPLAGGGFLGPAIAGQARQGVGTRRDEIRG
jgi:hypothetical protein